MCAIRRREKDSYRFKNIKAYKPRIEKDSESNSSIPRGVIRMDEEQFGFPNFV